MRQINEHTDVFRQITQRTLEEFFGLTDTTASEIVETNSVSTKKSFIVSIYYTGTVYGEYLLALDEETAARIVGIDEPITDENRDSVRDTITDALSETLNMIVGESIVQLQQSYAKLTITAPRVFFGEVRYPSFRTGRCVLGSMVGDIECHFCLDLMRLDLATSYEDAMKSLLEVNSKLKEANQHLAEQQAQLVHSEKMASIGILASGVAHEINNPLFFVDANLATLNDYLTIIDSMLGLYDKLCCSIHAHDPTVETALEAVLVESEDQDLTFVMEDTKHLVLETRDGVERIKSIVKGLKEFSHVDVGGVAEADLNVITENVLCLVAHELSHCETVDRELTPLPKVLCNAGEIGQVLVNVLMNSAQAIEGQGKISVRSYATESDVVLVVEDTGHGIPAESLDRIFEPFYTTKPVGKGVGLGLSISYGIIRKHNGSISVESAIGKGTKFTIRLPLVAQPAECVRSC